MHNAPWVQYPVGRFSCPLWAGAVLGLLSVLLTLSLLSLGLLRPSAAALSLGMVLLGAVWSLRGRSSEPAWLVWDGQGWQWWANAEGDNAIHVEAMSVQADFQFLLLLHLRRDQAPQQPKFTQWVWLYKGFAPAQWHGLRCAVYSRLNA